MSKADKLYSFLNGLAGAAVLVAVFLAAIAGGMEFLKWLRQ